MSPEQIAYVARRRRQLRYWPWLALVLVLLLAAAYGWLWQNARINIDPLLVLDQFNHKTVSDDELIMMAARGSLALITCGLFVLVILVLVSVALWNEYRLLRILDEVLPPMAAPLAPADATPGLESAAEAAPVGAVDPLDPQLPEEEGAPAAASMAAAPGDESPSANG